jgi:hypothetical protein
MSIQTVYRDGPAEPVSHLLSLGLSQLSIQVALSTSLTASSLGLAALATALVSTILTIQGAIAPHWQWTLLPAVAVTFTGLLATAVAGAEHIGTEEVFTAYEKAVDRPEDVGIRVLRMVWSVSLANDRALRLKNRLTAITLLWLVLAMLLIGILNLAGAIVYS